MPFDAERIEVLKMIQAKQISAEDGARLLKALVEERAGSASRQGPPPYAPPPPPQSGGARWFKVIVEEPNGEKVNFSLPLQTVPSMLRFASRWVPEQHRDALQAASEAIGSGFRGDLIRAEKPNGERIRIWIE
jgi:hypothetical protein